MYEANVAHHVELDELAINVTLYTDGTWELTNDIYCWTVFGEGFVPGLMHDIYDDDSLRDLIDLLAYGDDEETCPKFVREQLKYWTEYVCTWTDHLATGVAQAI